MEEALAHRELSAAQAEHADIDIAGEEQVVHAGMQQEVFGANHAQVAAHWRQQYQSILDQRPDPEPKKLCSPASPGCTKAGSPAAEYVVDDPVLDREDPLKAQNAPKAQKMLRAHQLPISERPWHYGIGNTLHDIPVAAVGSAVEQRGSAEAAPPRAASWAAQEGAISMHELRERVERVSAHVGLGQPAGATLPPQEQMTMWEQHQRAVEHRAWRPAPVVEPSLTLQELRERVEYVSSVQGGSNPTGATQQQQQQQLPLWKREQRKREQEVEAYMFGGPGGEFRHRDHAGELVAPPPWARAELPIHITHMRPARVQGRPEYEYSLR